MTAIERLLILLTSGWTTAVVFVVALVFFHIKLVWRSPLSKTGWKRVDYYWLAFGALGLVGASSQARETAIKAYSDVVDGYYQGFDPVQYTMAISREELTKRSQAVGQPPEVKLAYEDWQKWLNDLHDRVAASASGARIDESVLANEPIVLVEGATSATKDIRQAIRTHNQWVERRAELALATRQSMGEDMLRLFSPVLLACQWPLQASQFYLMCSAPLQILRLVAAADPEGHPHPS